MKLTKKCFYPWTFLQIHAGGLIKVCATQQDNDIGDFYVDYVEKRKRGIEYDIFNTDGIVRLRESLLTGNIRKMCRHCFFCPDEYITTEQFEKELKEYLRPRLKNININNADLRKIYSITICGIGLTNKCNLNCIYCVQSAQKDTNSFLKMEMSDEAAQATVDFCVELGPDTIMTCSEGESTLYKGWCKIYSELIRAKPDIKLQMSTNLNRRYSEDEIELMARYAGIDVSMESLNSERYSMMRRGGRVEFIIENLERIIKKADEIGIKRPAITLHSVVSDKTWRDLEGLADFAIEKGFDLVLGDYEERPQTVAYRESLLKPISKLPVDEQKTIRDFIKGIREKCQANGRKVFMQGNIFSVLNANVEKNYNLFKPFDDNPIYTAFYRDYPKGVLEKHFDIVYDHDNISYDGILLSRGEKLALNMIDSAYNAMVIREVQVFKEGATSHRYGQTVWPGYRKKVTVKNGVFNYAPDFSNENVEKILIEISEFWKE